MSLIYLEKYPTESVTFEIDCSGQLAASELITGEVQMSADPALTGDDALAFRLPVVNSSPITYGPGKTVPAGKIVQVRISGGSVPNGQRQRAYSVLATFETSLGNTVVAKATLIVKSTKPEVFI